MRPNCQKSCGTCGCTGQCFFSHLIFIAISELPVIPISNNSADTYESCMVDASACKFANPIPSNPSLNPVASGADSGDKYQVCLQASFDWLTNTFITKKKRWTFVFIVCSRFCQDCCQWAVAGECDANPFWMRVNCQKSCGTAGCDGMLHCTVCFFRKSKKNYCNVNIQ